MIYRLIITLATTTRMIPALGWAAMRAIFNVSLSKSEGQNHKTVSTNHNLF